MSDRVAPQSLEAEEHVLGSVLISPAALDTAIDLLGVEDFYRETHGAIYAAAAAMQAEGIAVDAITIIERLTQAGALERIGGRGRIFELANIVPATANVRHYAKIVRDHAVRRKLIASGQRIAELGFEPTGDGEELLESAEREVLALRSDDSEGGFVIAQTAVEEAMKRLSDLYERGSEITGLPTGFRDLDRLTAGLQEGNLIVLGARPSLGKSSLCIGMCAHIAIHLGLPVALFSLEMSRSEVIHRLIAMEAHVELHKLRSGRLDGEQWSKVYAAGSKIAKAPLYIDDGGTLTAGALRARARRLKMRHRDLKLIAVDYMQLMGDAGPQDNRVQEVSHISRGLKTLARDLEVPVLALSQLSRKVEERHDKRPMLSDLRESGSIEQDADLVIFLYRDDYYHPEDSETPGIAEAIVAKHRNGPTSTVKLAWVSRNARFSDLALAGDLGGAR